jgi:hypothetical protein
LSRLFGIFGTFVLQSICDSDCYLVAALSAVDDARETALGVQVELEGQMTMHRL